MNTPFVTVDTITYTTVKCKCPLCGKHEWTVSHLFADAAKRSEGYYPVYWDCAECFAKFDIRIYADQHVEFSQTGTNENPFIESIVLLRSSMVGEGGTPIYAVLNTRSFKDQLEKEKAEPFSSSLDYYYNDGTCPTNWLRDVIALVQDGDPDPHGCFEFVGARPRAELLELLNKRPDAERHNANNPKDFITDNLRLIFPELFSDGEVIDGEQAVEPKLLAQGSMDKLDGDGMWPKSQEQIQQENEQAWKEFFLRIERRGLVDAFCEAAQLTEGQYKTLLRAHGFMLAPREAPLVVEFMQCHQIPSLTTPDPLAPLDIPKLPDIGRGLIY